MNAEKMSPAPVQDGAIRVNVAMPVTRIGFGPLSFDPVEQLIGAKISDVLEPLMVGPVQRRPSAAGPAVDVYPLALPAGEGASLRLGAWGELGFRNSNRLLVVTVPLPAAGWVGNRLGNVVVRGPVEALSTDRTARVAEFWIRLSPGMQASLPLGVLGEVGIEAA